MQYRITQPSKLLNRNGELMQRGYATSLLLKYEREKVAYKSRLKEWDYYLIYNQDYGVALTIGNSGGFLLISATFLDFNKATEHTKSIIAFVPSGKFKMPESSVAGDIHFQNNRLNISMKHEKNTKKLYLKMKDFNGTSELLVSMVLSDEPKDSMVIATPFKESRKDFYYNQKIIGMKAYGKVRYQNTVYNFDKSNSFGLLDWGRGVWPYKTTWYWSAGQGIINRKRFGFNLGYGFGDTSAATENMLFYNGIAHKLGDVTFIISNNSYNRPDYRKPWFITSSDHRVEMVFVPVLDRNASFSAVAVSTDQHQVFGKFTGRVILDNKTTLELKDFLGFAEHVKNRW